MPIIIEIYFAGVSKTLDLLKEYGLYEIKEGLNECRSKEYT